MDVRGAMMPGVGVAEGAEVDADILRYDKGESRCGKDKCQICERERERERCSNRGVDPKDRWRIDGR
jgi:hypothetical protein